MIYGLEFFKVAVNNSHTVSQLGAIVGAWEDVEKHIFHQAVQKCSDARRARPEE